MAKRVTNPNLAKIHRNYTVEEVAGLFDMHKNTVRNWIKTGLPVCDDRRPTLILGEHLRAFLQSQKTARKRRCREDQLYCLRCRVPQRPADDMVDYLPINATTGCLKAICPSCFGMMNRYISAADLARIRARLDVCLPKAMEHIGNSDDLPVHCDFS